MKKYSFTTFLFLFSFVFATLPSYAQSDINSIKANDFYFLIDHDTQEILLSKNADTRLAPSSMTKIMTAYVVFDQIRQGRVNLDNECIIGKDAFKKRGSSMFLNYGDIVSIDNLLKGLLAVSGNDASIALAQSVGGSIDNFVALMNFKARELGLKNSNFKNPHGLNEDGHYMSLRDLATLISHVYQDFPEFEPYLSVHEFTYHNITQPNSNPLLKTHYDGIVGGKTGYTNDGGYGVVASVKRGNRRLIAVVNKSRTSKQRTHLITQLFDYGFENYKKITLFEKDQTVTKLNTWMGNKNKVEIASNQEISFNIPKEINADAIKVKVDYETPIYAPIVKGTKVATLKIEIKDYKTLQYSLFAKENVQKAKFLNKVKQKLSYKLSIFYKKAVRFLYAKTQISFANNQTRDKISQN